MTVFGLRAPPAKLLLTAARRVVAWAIFQRKCFTSLGCLVTGGRNTAPTCLSKSQAGGFFLLRTEIGDERIFMWGFCLFLVLTFLIAKKCGGNSIFLEQSWHQVREFLCSLLEACYSQQFAFPKPPIST